MEDQAQGQLATILGELVKYSAMEKILWSGDHLGAYLWDCEGMGAEVSFYRVIWSPEGVGFVAFVRFSGKTELTAMNGIYTDNKKVSDYMTSYALRRGKPLSNIENIISSPVFEAVCESENKLPFLLTERINAENGLLEIRWHGLNDLKFYKPEKHGNPIR